MTTNIRSLIGAPVIFFVTVYSLALTCSMAAMEIAGWGTFLFFVLYLIIDRMSPKKDLEIHTLGIELPLICFVIVAICGLRINAPDSDLVFAIGSLRNLILLFAFTYSLQVVKNLNRIFLLMLFAATAISGYAIWQHFSGIDLWRHSNRALQEIPGVAGAFASVGFFGHHLTYGHSYMMFLCVPWAALLLARRVPWWQMMGFVLSFGLILTSLIFAYGRGVWIAILVALPLMAFFASRKLFVSALALLLIVGGITMKTSTVFRDRALSVFSETDASNEERKQLWHINFEMFHDHPWIGVGYKQNEPLSQEYYKKLGIVDGISGNAHSNYVELLATTSS